MNNFNFIAYCLSFLLIIDYHVLANESSEQRELKNLGFHPKTKRPITVRLTKYGPTIQMGTKEDEEKPKWAALMPHQKRTLMPSH